MTMTIHHQRRERERWLSTIVGLVLGLILTLSIVASGVDAYRVGDVVDAVISTRSSNSIEMLMNSRPLFGVPKTIQLARLPERFAIHFEEGLHSIPFVDGQTLDQLIVTFVYSKSGDGRIHSVSSRATRAEGASGRSLQRRPIDVVFEWVEEEAVDFAGGSAVMFVVVMVVSIVFLVQLCGIDTASNDHARMQSHSQQTKSNKSASLAYGAAGSSRYGHQQ